MKLDSLTPCFVEYIPEVLEHGILYVSEAYGVCNHLCACGCGEQTVLPFECVDGWLYNRDGDLVTLEPSIGNFHVPCGSHYYIRRNAVVWV